MRISDWSSDVCSSDLPAHRLDRERDIDVARIRYRLAGIERFHQRQRVGLALHAVGEREQDRLLRARRQIAPPAILERGACGGDRQVDIRPPGTWTLIQNGSVAWGDVVEHLALRGRPVAAVDDEAVRQSPPPPPTPK